MNKLRSLNPINWIRAFSHFIWSWFVTLPFAKLGAASPAIIALATVAIIIVLTFTSDPQWRKGLVMDQIVQAKSVGSKEDVALLARRLLMENPNDQAMEFEVAVAGIDGDRKEQAKQVIERLAKKGQYGRAALWLLEHDFSPIKWGEWDEKKRADFGSLLSVAATDQPDNKMVSSIYADYLLLTGSQEKALGEITKLVSVQPARALQGAMILRQSGRESQAATMARDGLDFLAKQGTEEPENVQLALMRAQFALFLKQYDSAIEILNSTAKVSSDPRLRSGTAEVLVLWSRDQMAITNPTERFARQLSLLSKAVEIAPNHPLVINDLMTVALQCADAQDPKVAQLRDLLVQGVAPELSHFIRGTAAMMRDDVDEATLHLELSVKSLPAVPAVLNNLAVALTTREGANLDRAIKLVDAALKQVPNQPYFHETRAQILLKQKKYADAIVSFERALPAEGLREQVHDGLGECYNALGQADLAKQHIVLADKIRESKKTQGPMDDVNVDFSKTQGTKDKTPDAKDKTQDAKAKAATRDSLLFESALESDQSFNSLKKLIAMRQTYCLLVATVALVIAPLVFADDVAEPAAGEAKVLFNGDDLTGWSGDPRLWSVRDGVIHGETTAENAAKGNTFLIWQGGTLKDFELQLSFRCNATNNSGIQYRSQHITEGKVSNEWVVRGYQHELRNQNKFPDVSGFIYDEGGSRKRICAAGEKAVWNESGREHVGELIDQAAFTKLMKIDDWNDVRIVAKGNHIQHYLNGTLILDFTDNEPKLQRLEGAIALQLHAGKPMFAEFKDIRLTTID